MLQKYMQRDDFQELIIIVSEICRCLILQELTKV